MGPGRCLPVAFRCHVSGRPGICRCYSPRQPRPGPQPRSLILSPRSGSVLIKMPSLRPWPRSGRLPEKPRPFPQPQATKAIFQPLSVHSKLKGRCFNPSRGRKREENAKGLVQVPKRVSAASSCPVHGCALGNKHCPTLSLVLASFPGSEVSLGRARGPGSGG